MRLLLIHECLVVVMGIVQAHPVGTFSWTDTVQRACYEVYWANVTVQQTTSLVVMCGAAYPRVGPLAFVPGQLPNSYQLSNSTGTTRVYNSFVKAVRSACKVVFQDQSMSYFVYHKEHKMMYGLLNGKYEIFAEGACPSE